MHAYALEEVYPYLLKQRTAHPTVTLKVLDVGCGSGYLTAAIARWFRQAGTNQPGTMGEGLVYGIDIHPQLVQTARTNMMKHDADLLHSGTVTLDTANGWDGLPAMGPFDAIHVGASAAQFPRALAQQLKPGGVMIIPVGPQSGTQYLYRVERLSGNGPPDAFDPQDYEVTKLIGVRYVPLVDKPVEHTP